MTETEFVIALDYHFPESLHHLTAQDSRLNSGSDTMNNSSSDAVLPAEKGDQNFILSLDDASRNSRKRLRHESGQVLYHKISSSLYKPIAPSPSATTLLAFSPSQVQEGVVHSPSPLVRSSLLLAAAGTTKSNSSSSLSFLSPSQSPISSSAYSSSLYTEKAYARYSLSSPFFERHQIQPSYSSIPLRDPGALKRYLSEVDLRHFGFGIDEESRSGEDSDSSKSAPLSRSPKYATNYTKKSTSVSSSMSLSHSSPIGKDDTFYLQDEDFEVYRSTRIAAMKRPKVPSSPISFAFLPVKSQKRHDSPTKSPPSSPAAGNNYKGKYGPNPSCASCQTTKTPYWRDAWNTGVLLCNACGLRFAKFKRRCISCHYVPRKEDKGGRHCTQCGGSWTQ